MESTLDLLFTFPSNPAESLLFKQKMIEEIQSGERSAIKIKAQLARVLFDLKEITDSEEMRKEVLSEIELNNGEYKGEHFTAKQGEFGTKYDFSECGNSIWESAKKEEELAANKRKYQEDLMKLHKESWVNEETGEVINPPVKTSNTNVSITLNKK